MSKWNDKTVAIEAKKYSTRTEFAQGTHTAYAYALKTGLLDSLIPRKNTPLTVESVTEEAKKYSTRTEFAQESYAAYTYALKAGLMDSLIPRRFAPLTFEAVAEEAKKYSSRSTLRESNERVYRFALKNNLLDRVFPPINSPWTLETAKAEAKKHRSRSSLHREAPGAYSILNKHDLLGKYFGAYTNLSHDCFMYIWKSNEGWWKYGKTSKSSGFTRLKLVAKLADTSITELHMWQSTRQVPFEENIQHMGTPLGPEVTFDGFSTCRWYTEDEVETIKDTAQVLSVEPKVRTDDS